MSSLELSDSVNSGQVIVYLAFQMVVNFVASAVDEAYFNGQDTSVIFKGVIEYLERNDLQFEVDSCFQHCQMISIGSADVKNHLRALPFKRRMVRTATV